MKMFEAFHNFWRLQGARMLPRENDESPGCHCDVFPAPALIELMLVSRGVVYHDPKFALEGWQREGG